MSLFVPGLVTTLTKEEQQVCMHSYTCSLCDRVCVEGYSTVICAQYSKLHELTVEFHFV